MAIYAVGDVQGCHEALQRLLDKLAFDPANDTLWLTGDLVNRGNDSLGVLRLVRSLGSAALTVLGNHDLHLLAVAAGHARARKRDTLGAVLAAPDRDELLDWLRRQPLARHDTATGSLLVHAGVPPQWDVATTLQCAHEVESVLLGVDCDRFLAKMYGNTPDRWSPDLSGTARWRFIVNCLTRMRYCTATGRLDLECKGPPGTQADGLMPWFRAPGRLTANVAVVFGHWSTLGRVKDPGVYSLDTGCVWGGRLTALPVAPRGIARSVRCSEYASPGAG